MSPVMEEAKKVHDPFASLKRESEIKNAAMERELELKRLQDLRASYRKHSVENKEVRIRS